MQGACPVAQLLDYESACDGECLGQRGIAAERRRPRRRCGDARTGCAGGRHAVRATAACLDAAVAADLVSRARAAHRRERVDRRAHLVADVAAMANGAHGTVAGGARQPSAGRRRRAVAPRGRAEGRRPNGERLSHLPARDQRDYRIPATASAGGHRGRDRRHHRRDRDSRVPRRADGAELAESVPRRRARGRRTGAIERDAPVPDDRGNVPRDRLRARCRSAARELG